MIRATGMWPPVRTHVQEMKPADHDVLFFCMAELLYMIEMINV